MTEIHVEPVNWGQVLDELKLAGYSQYFVAKALGRHWNTVEGWREHEPRHADGQALLTLHMRLTTRV